VPDPGQTDLVRRQDRELRSQGNTSPADKQ
jgi:hypothetical protein